MNRKNEFKSNVGSQVHAHNDKHSYLKNYSNSLPILEWWVTEEQRIFRLFVYNNFEHMKLNNKIIY